MLIISARLVESPDKLGQPLMNSTPVPTNVSVPLNSAPSKNAK
jgi:hypothetical protein